MRCDLAEDDHGVPQFHFVFVVEAMTIGYPDAVDIGAVGRAEILQPDTFLIVVDTGMASADGPVRHRNVRRHISTDDLIKAQREIDNHIEFTLSSRYAERRYEYRHDRQRSGATAQFLFSAPVTGRP